jgi:hypothetical protein
MRIIATVKRGQVFSLALGTASLVDSDLLVFTAGSTAALSTVQDSRASQAGIAPVAETQSAIQTASITEIPGAFIRFDLSRSLSPGLAKHYNFKKGSTHTIGWGQYKTADFKIIPTENLGTLGTCSLGLTELAGSASLCPAAAAPAPVNTCTPSAQSCYDSTTYTFANSKCASGNSCARWIETSPNGAAFYLDGCLPSKCCGTSG